MQGNNPVNETIDERILRLLGLLEVFDLDYDTYKTLLKEQLVLVTSTRKKIPPEEFELLKNEFKRVRSKTGRFIPKKKKPITANNISNLNSLSKKLLKGTVATKEQPQQKQDKSSITSNSLLGIITSIHKLVENIHGAIQYQTNLFRNQYERDRRASERLRRGEEEERLETKKDGFLAKAKKILSPFESIFDRILRFLVFTILGRAFKLFMDWASDPENRKKLETIGRFLKDWWPALLGAWFFFANPLGSFIRTIVGTVAKLTFKLAKFAIPKLLKFVAANPKAFAVAAAIGGGAYLATKVTGQQEAAPIQAENKAKAQRGKTLDIRGTDTPIDKSPSVGDMGPSTPFGLLQGVNTGGIIRPLIQGVSNGGSVFSGLVDKDTGETVSGAGPDTQFLPVEDGGGAVLQRGEVVLQKGARERMMQQAGVDPLAYNIGSNANKPRKINADTLASSYGGLIGLSNGGEIGTATHHLKQDEALSSLTPGINDFTRPGSSNWSKVNANTMVHSYLDSKNVPTIGWGSTFYDNILNGKRPVRMGDKISKTQADNILNANVSNLSKEYSTKIPHWGKMSNNQRAGLLILGYNAPNGPTGVYPNLTKSLQQGDMRAAAQHVQRDGPNAERIALERKLLLSGPPIVRNLVGEGRVGPEIVGSGIPFIPPFLYNMQQRMQKKQGGGKVEEGAGFPNPHSSTDRRIVSLQPGEGIITRLAMQRGAEPLVETINALLDPNSEAAKSGTRTALIDKTKPKSINISPPIRGRGGIAPITLPPISQSSGNVPTSSTSGTQVPPFATVSSAVMSVRINNADTYGITG
jgi:GH24 family phage-related lysozyme (muramidase)